MLLSTSGVRMPIRSLPALGERRSRARRRSSRPVAAAPASERMPMFSAIDQSGKMPSVCRSPATSATGAATAMPGMRRDARLEDARAAARVWPWPARPARPMISPSMGDELGAVGLPLAAGRGRATGVPPRACVAGAASAPRVARRRPWRRPACRGRRRRRGRSPTTLPSRITTMRSEVSRISPRRCEIRMQLAAAATKRRTKASSWPAACASSEEVGSSRMTRLSGSSVTVKARATSTIWRRPIDRSRTMSPAPMPWPGKISSSLLADQIAGPAPPAEAGAAPGA